MLSSLLVHRWLVSKSLRMSWSTSLRWCTQERELRISTNSSKMSSMRDSSRKTSKKLTRMGMLLGVWAMKSKFKKTNLLLQGLHCKLVKKKSMAMKTKAPLMTPIQKMTNPMTSGLPWIQALSSLWTTKGLCLKEDFSNRSGTIVFSKKCHPFWTTTWSSWYSSDISCSLVSYFP